MLNFDDSCLIEKCQPAVGDRLSIAYLCEQQRLIVQLPYRPLDDIVCQSVARVVASPHCLTLVVVIVEMFVYSSTLVCLINLSLATTLSFL